MTKIQKALEKIHKALEEFGEAYADDLRNNNGKESRNTAIVFNFFYNGDCGTAIAGHQVLCAGLVEDIKKDMGKNTTEEKKRTMEKLLKGEKDQDIEEILDLMKNVSKKGKMKA